jgi:predicted Zn-dependent peptidase
MRGADDGIFMVYGLLNEGVSHEEADQKLGTLLQHYLQADAFKEREFEAVKNKIASHLLFEKTSLMNRAQKLCYFEWLGNAEGVNLELAVYENNTLHDLIETAQTTLVPEKVSNLYYNPLS